MGTRPKVQRRKCADLSLRNLIEAQAEVVRVEHLHICVCPPQKRTVSLWCPFKNPSPKLARSSSREVIIRAPTFFFFVYFSMRTLAAFLVGFLRVQVASKLRNMISREIHPDSGAVQLHDFMHVALYKRLLWFCGIFSSAMG